MTEILQLAQLVQHHRVAKVNVGRGRIEPELATQWLAGRRRACQLVREFAFNQEFVAAALGNGQGAIDIGSARKLGRRLGHGCGNCTRQLRSADGIG